MLDKSVGGGPCSQDSCQTSRGLARKQKIGNLFMCCTTIWGPVEASQCEIGLPTFFSTTQCGAMDPRSVLGAVHCSEMWFCMGNKYLWRRREGQKVFNLQTQYSASVVAAFGPGGNMGGVGQWDV